jgi:hypothetical protein
MTTVQMLLSQLGINANAGSVALMGPNGRQLRLAAPPMMPPEAHDPAAAAGQGSEAVNGAITSAMQSLTMQLMPQQHRLLALPPRLPASESAALLASAGSAAGAAAGTAAAAAAGEAGLRGQASNVNALTRLLTRAPEAGAGGYLRDGRARISARTGPGGFMLNPATLPPPNFGLGANLLQSFEMWQQGALGGAGGNMMGDMGDSVWDEAVNQLLEALAPPGRGLNRLGAPAMPGQAAGRAGAAAGDDAGLDPRE